LALRDETSVQRRMTGMVRRYAAVSLAGAALAAFGAYCATHSVDFPVYYRTAQQVVRGDYEFYPAAVYQGLPAPPHGFRYAPIAAFLMAPLALAPLKISAFVFFALKTWAIAYIGLVTARHAGLSARPTRAIALALLLVGGYAVEEFRYGNCHVLIVALMVMAFDWDSKGRVAVPALALGLAIAVKLTPALLLAHFAWRRRVWVCVATLGALVLLAVLPALVVGHAQNDHLLHGFARYAMEKVDEGDNYAFRGVLLRTSLAPNMVSMLWVAGVAIAAIVIAAVLPAAPTQSTTRLLEFSIVLTATLLVSPHTQRRYFVTLFVPVLALVAVLMQQRRWRDDVLVWGALAATAAAGTVLPMVYAGRALALEYESLAPYFFATVGLMYVLVVVARRFSAEDRVATADVWSVNAASMTGASD
jgi:glycosyl transferase family 87